MTTEQKRLQLTLWAAFVTGVAIYPTALTVIVHQWRPAFDSDLLARLQIECILAALIQTLAAFWFFSRGGGAQGQTTSELGSLWSYAVAWALSEAIGIYGLVVGLWRGEPEVSTLFFTWAITLILVLRPPAARRSSTALAPTSSASSPEP